MSLSPQFLDEIRARTSLSSLVQRSVPIKKKGSEWSGCCPFHDEKTPSFYVSDQKAFYHCFGCGAHGDAIRWLTDHNGMQFIDAVKELAQAAGMDMPAADPRQAERDREREQMLDIMGRAARWFTMQKPGSDRAMDYLEGRGVSPGVALQFDVGYAPRGRGVPRLLEALADVPFEKLRDLGLVKRREEGERAGEVYDVFRGRVMFPIHDARGRVIGFGGRILGEGEPKYLNSPDTPLFDKGRTLFNIHRASQPARKAGRLIVVEGYMDVIALARAEIQEVVAPNGTALTEAQMQLAWRMADIPILCMDGDKAGKAAMARAAIRALPLLEPGKSLAFVTPPEGKDPDDVLREGGLAAVQALFSSPRPLADVLWTHEYEAEPCDTPEQVAGLKARMRDHVRSIKNADVREAYGLDIAARFDRAFRHRGPAIAAKSGTRPAGGQSTERRQFSRPAPPPSRAMRDIARGSMTDEIERAMLIGLLRFPDLWQVAGLHFHNPEIGALIDELSESAAISRGDIDRMKAEIEDLELADRVADATRGRALPFSYARARISDPARAHTDLAEAVKAMRSAPPRSGARHKPSE